MKLYEKSLKMITFRIIVKARTMVRFMIKESDVQKKKLSWSLKLSSCSFNLLNKNFFWNNFWLSQIGIALQNDWGPFGAKVP